MHKSILIFFILLISFIPGDAQTLSDYTEIEEFQNGVAVAYKNDDSSVLINERGEDVLSFKCIEVVKVSGKENGYYLVIDESEKYGMVNAKGEITLDIKYDRIYTFLSHLGVSNIDNSGGFAYLILNGKKGLIDHSGKIIAEPIYDALSHFTDGNSIYSLRAIDGKYGIVKENEDMTIEGEGDKILIDLKYEDIEHKEESNTFQVKLNGLWGLFDSNGKKVIDFRYQRISKDFDSNGLAIVQIPNNNDENSLGAVNRKGETIINFKYAHIVFLPKYQKYKVMAIDEGVIKEGYVNLKGELIRELKRK